MQGKRSVQECSWLLAQVPPGLHHENINGARDTSPRELGEELGGDGLFFRGARTHRLPSLAEEPGASLCRGSEKGTVTRELVNLMDSAFLSGVFSTRRDKYTVQEHPQVRTTRFSLKNRGEDDHREGLAAGLWSVPRAPV